MATLTKSLAHILEEVFLGVDADVDQAVVFGNVTAGTTMVAEKHNTISGLGATRTLVAAESGSTVLLDRAAGIVVTLPAAAVGLEYEFVATVSVTSNSYKVITSAGTVFLLGTLVNVDTDTSNAVAAFSGNGTSHVAITSNGTTTGGLIGTRFRVRCVSSTLWLVDGVENGSGIVATMFATS